MRVRRRLRKLGRGGGGVDERKFDIGQIFERED